MASFKSFHNYSTTTLRRIITRCLLFNTSLPLETIKSEWIPVQVLTGSAHLFLSTFLGPFCFPCSSFSSTHSSWWLLFFFPPSAIALCSVPSDSPQLPPRAPSSSLYDLHRLYMRSLLFTLDEWSQALWEIWSITRGVDGVFIHEPSAFMAQIVWEADSLLVVHTSGGVGASSCILWRWRNRRWLLLFSR